MIYHFLILKVTQQKNYCIFWSEDWASLEKEGEKIVAMERKIKLIHFQWLTE